MKFIRVQTPPQRFSVGRATLAAACLRKPLTVKTGLRVLTEKV